MGTETEAVLAGGGGRLLERYRVQEPKRQVRMGGGGPRVPCSTGGWPRWLGTLERHLGPSSAHGAVWCRLQ